MAIAFDSATAGINNATGVNSLSFSHTVGSGSNRLLFLLVGFGNDGGDVVNTPTYNGVSMTLVTKVNSDGTGRFLYLFALVAPTSGSNTVAITTSGSVNVLSAVAMGYSGAQQSTTMDASGINTGTGTSISKSITTVADNCWLAGGVWMNSDSITAGASTTVRATSAGDGRIAGIDSNAAKTPPGSYSLTTNGNNDVNGIIVASFAPAGGTTVASSATTMMMGI